MSAIRFTSQPKFFRHDSKSAILNHQPIPTAPVSDTLRQNCFIAMWEHEVKYIRALLTECHDEILNGKLQFSGRKVQFETFWVREACARPRGQFPDDPVFHPGRLLCSEVPGVASASG